MMKVASRKPPLFLRSRKPFNRAVTDYDPKEVRKRGRGLVLWGEDKEIDFFWQIAYTAIQAAKKRSLPCPPIIIGIDGSPGTGKSFFARKLANYLNLNAGHELREPCFAQVFQMDELLTGQHKNLSTEPGSPQEADYHDPAFWYNLDRLPQILQTITSRSPLQEVTIDGLYNRNSFDGSQEFFFPPIKHNFLLLEGCYALHQSHSALLDFGVYLWQQDWSYTSFFLRSQIRGYFDEQKTEPSSPNNFYEIIIQSYIQYLKNLLALEKTTWLLRIKGLAHREAKLTLEELREEEKAVLFQQEIVQDLETLREKVLAGTIA